MKDITGLRFGKLVAIKPTEKRDNIGRIMWLCKCDCGNEVVVSGYCLRNGGTKSCGCLKPGSPRKKESEMEKIKMNGFKFIRKYILHMTLEELSEVLNISKQRAQKYETKISKIPENRLTQLENFSGIDKKYFTMSELSQEEKTKLLLATISYDDLVNEIERRKSKQI